MIEYCLAGEILWGPKCVRGSRMGRGRQKAKHTKVARELKYFSPNTNLTELERELAQNAEREANADPWEEYASKYNTDDEDEN